MAMLFFQMGVINRAGGVHSTPAIITFNVGTPKGQPNTTVARRAHLHDQLSGRFIAEKWTEAGTGTVQFHGLAAGTYCVIAFDHTGQYGGDCETDIVVPAP